MDKFNPVQLWKRFLALPNDSLAKTFGVAFLVAFTCAAVVSVTAVTLKPLHELNLKHDREARLAEMIAALPGMMDILSEADADTLETVIVDLDRGEIDTVIDPGQFDYLAAQSKMEVTTPIPADADIAGIVRRPNHAPVHLLRDGQSLVLVVLPIYGTGYQSTIRAYLALEGDLATIAAVSIFEQKETPGLGTRITDPAWLALWEGRQGFDETGAVRISVVKGGASGRFEIDAISGATRSSMGVGNLVQFWLGDFGFGPFLKRLKEGGVR